MRGLRLESNVTLPDGVDPEALTSAVERFVGGEVTDIVVRECSRAAAAGDFPNGGLWRFSGDADERPWSVVLKRLDPNQLGSHPVWGAKTGREHASWYAREALFYPSDLNGGWNGEVRAARGLGIRRPASGGFDVWLEHARIPVFDRTLYRAAVTALAQWQVRHRDADHGFLSDNWLVSHLARHKLDNVATAHHPNWPHALSRGLSPTVHAAVSARVTDPAIAAERLAKLPQLVTHYDFHHGNIGRSEHDGVGVIIDWAYVGKGPVGHDAGHLALDVWDRLGEGATPESVWADLSATYIDALRAAGWSGGADGIRAAMEQSIAIRAGWVIDYVLNLADKAPDDGWRVLTESVAYAARLIERYR